MHYARSMASTFEERSGPLNLSGFTFQRGMTYIKIRNKSNLLPSNLFFTTQVTSVGHAGFFFGLIRLSAIYRAECCCKSYKHHQNKFKINFVKKSHHFLIMKLFLGNKIINLHNKLN